MTKTTQPKPVALVDMDGTLCDYASAMERDQRALLAPGEEPRLAAEDEDKYEYVKARRRFIKSQPNWWYNLERLPSGFRMLELLREVGFKLHILTRGPKNLPAAWAEKVRWCREHVPDASVTVTLDKALVYGRVLVDDWVPYVTPWLENRPRGLVLMPDQPWNKSFKHAQVIRWTNNEAEVVAALVAQRDRETES